MKKLVLICFVLFCVLAKVNAQTVVISEHPDTVSELKTHNWGPNQPHYMSWVLGCGFTLNNGVADYNPIPGRYFETGIFYQNRFSRPLSLIIEIDYQRITNLYKPSLVSIPEIETTRKGHWYNFNAMAGFSIDLRPNRGNVLGPSIDLFFVNAYNHRIGYETIVKHIISGEKSIFHKRNLKLDSRLMNGVRAELNLGAMSLTYNYWFEPLAQVIDEGERVDFIPHMVGIKFYTTY